MLVHEHVMKQTNYKNRRSEDNLISGKNPIFKQGSEETFFVIGGLRIHIITRIFPLFGTPWTHVNFDTCYNVIYLGVDPGGGAEGAFTFISLPGTNIFIFFSPYNFWLFHYSAPPPRKILYPLLIDPIQTCRLIKACLGLEPQYLIQPLGSSVFFIVLIFTAIIPL